MYISIHGNMHSACAMPYLCIHIIIEYVYIGDYTRVHEGTYVHMWM